MKQIKLLITLVILITISSQLYSQLLSDIVSDDDLNYFEKIEEIENNQSKYFDNADEADIKRYNRWSTFWDSRVDAEGSFFSYLDALQNYTITGKGENQQIWNSIGPIYSMIIDDENDRHIGRAECIWVNPNDTSEIFIGSNNGGLFKTNDGGENWRLLTEEFAYGVHDIDVDTVNNLMYIATGVYANALLKYGYYGYGVYRSSDWGETWIPLQQISPDDMIFIKKVEVSLFNDSVVYALSVNQLLRSGDFGQTWEVILNKEGGKALYDFSQNPQNEDQMAVSGDSCLYTSNYGGLPHLWSGNLYLNLTDTTDIMTNDQQPVNIDYSSEGTLWAIYLAEQKDYNYVKKSIDNGQTWINPQLGGNNHHIYGTKTIRFIKAVDDSLIWAGGIYSYKSGNGAETFVPKYGLLHIDIRDIYFPDPANNNLIYTVTDGGVNKTTTGGNYPGYWKKIYGNLALNECFTVAISEQDPEYMLMGTIDNGTYRRDSTGWKLVLGGDNALAVISWANDSVNIAAIKHNRLISTERFHNGNFDLFNISGAAWDSPVIQHPNEPETYFAGKWHVNITENEGDDWGSFGTFGHGGVTAMAISKSNPDYFYAAKQNLGINYFAKKTDYYGSFQDKSYALPNGMRNTRITEIEVHPENHNKVWISLGNFAEDNKNFTIRKCRSLLE